MNSLCNKPARLLRRVESATAAGPSRVSNRPVVAQTERQPSSRPSTTTSGAILSGRLPRPVVNGHSAAHLKPRGRVVPPNPVPAGFQAGEKAAAAVV